MARAISSPVFYYFRQNLLYPESYNLSPWDPYQSQETTKNISDTVAYFLAKYWMVEFMLEQPQLVPIPTPAYESISHTLRYPGPNMWSPWGPHQSTDTI